MNTIYVKCLQTYSIYAILYSKEGDTMTTISLRIDDDMKRELDEMCAEMGMNLSTFYMIYTKRALRDRKIPFDIEAPADPFYSKSNVTQLRKSVKQVEEGNVIVKTMDELEAMAIE